MLYDVTIDGKNYRLDLNRADGRWSCRLDGQELEVDAVLARPDVLSLRIGNRAYEVKSRAGRRTICICGLGARGSPPKFAILAHCAAAAARWQTIRAQERSPLPCPGKWCACWSARGDEVEPGAGVAVVEAMKMQNEIKSPKKGTVQKILVSEGAAVNAGDVLAVVE